MSDGMSDGLISPHDRNVLPYSRPGTPHVHSQIGFVGLGAMGYLMARNLARAHVQGSFPLLVWNRSTAKSHALQAELGADHVRIAQSPAQVAMECDVIISNLANDEVVKAIYEEYSKALSNTLLTRHKIFVETSTMYPKLAGELDVLISGISRCHLITCPVFGAPAAADKAQLVLCMSGDYRWKKEVAFLLVPAVGRKVIDLGENLEKAPTLKLIGNSMIIGCLEILAESYTLAEKSGISAKDVQDIIKEVLPAPPLIVYGEKMANDLFDGKRGFAIDGGIKDASHIRRLTAEHNSPMPTIDVAHQHLLTSRALHAAHKLKDPVGKGTEFEVLDWSAIIAASRVAAGLEGFGSGKHSSVVRED